MLLNIYVQNNDIQAGACLIIKPLFGSASDFMIAKLNQNIHRW